MAASSPGSLRSSRKRALEIGTEPAGFEDGAKYDAQGGHPVSPDYPERTYEEQAPQTTEGGSKPIQQSNPIKLGG